MSALRKNYSNAQVVRFIIFLCFICALILAATALGLQKTQERAREFDQSKQMLIAAKMLTADGFFSILQSDGKPVRARFDEEKELLVEDSQAKKATDAEIKSLAELRIRPLLTDNVGKVFTLKEKNLDLATYLSEHKKTGYASLPLKLFYIILPNKEESAKITEEEAAQNIKTAEALIIPVSGFGLWAPIYGYLALSSNGDLVLGTTWYEHGETPGLGANIAEAWWQNQFYGKQIFQGGEKADPQSADMGIIVVKGKVRDVYGSSLKAQSAVDGISGATITGDGVTSAYRNSLTPYRALLVKLHEE